MKTLASFSAGRMLLARVGVAPRQYQILVDLFGALGERKELLGNLGMDAHALQLTSLGLLLPAAIIALFAFGPGSLASYNLMTLGVTSLVLFIVLVMEAANSFLNPAEVSVLAHRPISGPTYLAAKLTYLVIVVLRVEITLNGPAALTGLIKPDARWFYPVTHMAAAVGAGLFLALIACAVFGVLFRVMPASRLRSAALWLQVAVATVPLLINVVRRPMRWMATMIAPQGTAADWSFVPLMWFNALAVVGQGGTDFTLGWSAAAGLLLSMLFIVIGLRSLSSRYMSRIVGIMRASRGRGGRGHRRASPAAQLVKLFVGRPSGPAAAQFVWRMMRRDWQFRRAAAQMVLPLLVFGPALILSGREVSPFAADRLPPVGILPELVPLVTLAICLVLAYSDHWKGAWIFATTPAAGVGGFARGVYWSLWVPCLGVPFAAALVFFARPWGLIDAALFSVYGLAVASFLFGLQLRLVDGMPFGSAPRAERAHTLMPLIMFGPVVIGIAWVVQGQFLFRSRAVTAAATLLFVWAATMAGRYSVRGLEAKIHRGVANPADLPPGMFQGAEP